MKRNLLMMVAASIFLTSCDTVLHLSGTVINASDAPPVDSVRIYIGHQREECLYTDSLGRFEITQMTAGGFLGFPGLKISLEKEGYKPLKKVLP
jgi:hypothetical protein